MKYKITYQQKRKLYTRIVEVKDPLDLEKELQNFENIVNIKEIGVKYKRLILKNQKKEISLFFKQLNIMLQSELSFNDALDLIKQTTKEKDILQIIELLKSAVIQNYPIDLALDSYKKIIGDTPLNFLQQGIENGTIKNSIESIVILLEKEMIVKQTLVDKLRYPLFLVLSLIMALAMIFIYVIPGFEFIFSSLGDDLPIATKLLLFINNLIIQYWYLFVLFLCIVAVGVVIVAKKYKYHFDRLLFKSIPVINRVVVNYQLYKLFLSLYIIVQSKYQFQSAILSSIKTTTNLYLKEILIDISRGVKNGEDIVELFSRYPYFDQIVIKLLHTAQNTAQYETVLLDITNYYEESFNEKLKTFTATIEPLMIFIIASMVLWLILAIMIPIWELSSVGL